MDPVSLKVRNQARGIVINRRGEMLFVKYDEAKPADPKEPDWLAFWVSTWRWCERWRNV